MRYSLRVEVPGRVCSKLVGRTARNAVGSNANRPVTSRPLASRNVRTVPGSSLAYAPVRSGRPTFKKV